MNKSVKIILAIAMALLYPVVIFSMTMIIFPDSKLGDMQPPKGLNYNECYSDYSGGSSSSRSYSNTRSSLEQACMDRLRDEHEQATETYRANQDLAKAIEGEASTSRIKVALVFVILGFVVALLAKQVSAVSAGLLGGSTILLLFTSGFSVANSKYIDLVAEIFLLMVFMMLVALLLTIDKVFPLLPQSQAPETPAQAQAPETTTK